MRSSEACLAILLVLHAAVICSQTPGPASGMKAGAVPEPSGPVAVIDTTMGRLRCRLFAAERPLTTANFIALAEGTGDWRDPVSGVPQPGKPFFDGTRIYGIPTGIRGGTRVADGEIPARESLVHEAAPALRFDRAGRLGMRGKKGRISSSEFMILDHANSEHDSDDAPVFGQCDDESVRVVSAISHSLAVVDNSPTVPVAINHVTIVREGQSMPPEAAKFDAALVVPALKEARAETVPAPEPTGPTAQIETSMGRISCKLFSKESPIATATFIGLAEGTKSWTNPVTHRVEEGKRFYDGMAFSRVIPDFVIQSGDYTGDPSGSVDIGFRFRNETAPGLSYDRPGRLAFGNDGPDRNNSEIFITEHPMRALDGGFTIIGQCDQASIKVVEAIARVPRDKDNRPIKEVKIETVRFDGR